MLRALLEDILNFFCSFFVHKEPINLISYSFFSPNKLSKEHNEFSNRLFRRCRHADWQLARREHGRLLLKQQRLGGGGGGDVDALSEAAVRCPDEGSSGNDEIRKVALSSV